MESREVARLAVQRVEGAAREIGSAMRRRRSSIVDASRADQALATW
jgi:hypothetical protein